MGYSQDNQDKVIPVLASAKEEEICCAKCKLPKPLSRYRIRTKNGYTWRQGTCMDCEAEAKRMRYNADVEKARENQRVYYRKLPDKVKRERHKKQWLAKKGTVEWSNYRKKYWRENQKQRSKHKAVAKKYHNKIVAELTDNYVLRHITQRTGLKKEDVPKEMIEVVRAVKQFKRLTNVKRGNKRNA